MTNNARGAKGQLAGQNITIHHNLPDDFACIINVSKNNSTTSPRLTCSSICSPNCSRKQGVQPFIHQQSNPLSTRASLAPFLSRLIPSARHPLSSSSFLFLWPICFCFDFATRLISQSQSQTHFPFNPLFRSQMRHSLSFSVDSIT